MGRLPLVLLLVLAPIARAGDGDLVSWTTVGVDSAYAPAVKGVDANLLLYQRLRWQPATRGDLAVLVVADGRFRLDLKAPTLERYYVSALGVSLDAPGWSLRLGRHPVSHGGALLFDGVEFLGHPGPRWDLGAWAGASPDRYTGRPEARFGGGPVIAWSGSQVQASLVGEVLFAAGGLDRASALALLGYDFARGSGIWGRLDVQITDAAGRFGLADGAVFARWRPFDGLDMDVLYDAYGAERYLRTEDRDPALGRFSERADAAGVTEDLPQDALDPTISHLFGAGVRWRPPGYGDGPRASLVGRYRYHDDPSRRLLRGTASAGALLVEQRLDLGVVGTALFLDDEWRGEAGIAGMVEPTNARTLALDASGRVLFDNTAFDGRLGWAADLFVDWIGRGGWMLSGGVEWSFEPWQDFDDVGYRGFFTVTKRVSAPRDARGGDGSTPPPSPGTP